MVAVSISSWVTTTSVAPSPLKSPAAAKNAGPEIFTGESGAGASDPFPSPRRTVKVMTPESWWTALGTSTSRLSSPSRSQTAKGYGLGPQGKGERGAGAKPPLPSPNRTDRSLSSPLPVTRSILPSLLKSPAASPWVWALGPRRAVNGEPGAGSKRPVPSPRRTVTS
jgi:hypothetical protein